MYVLDIFRGRVIFYFALFGCCVCLFCRGFLKLFWVFCFLFFVCCCWLLFFVILGFLKFYFGWWCLCIFYGVFLFYLFLYNLVLFRSCARPLQ